jgi:hypothetical protein
LRHDYAAQRSGTNEQRDISRDKADITADRRDIVRDRADIRADQRDIRRDRADLRADEHELRGENTTARVGHNGDQRLNGEQWDAARRGGTLTAHAQGAAGAQASGSATTRARTSKPSAQVLTPTVMANNMAAEKKKPPSTQPVHQAWYHWIW